MPYKKHACGKLAQGLMTGRKVLSPPLSWLAPQSDHGSAARAETEAFFQYGPPQSFFELSCLALQKARARSWRNNDDRAQISKPPPSYGSLRNPITGVPRARKLKLFSNMARRNPFSRYWLALKKARREVGARTDDRAQISKPPPSWRSFRNPITGVPRARKLKLFSKMAPRNPFSS